MTTSVVLFADKHPTEMYTGKDSTIVLSPQQSAFETFISSFFWNNESK